MPNMWNFTWSQAWIVQHTIQIERSIQYRISSIEYMIYDIEFEIYNIETAKFKDTIYTYTYIYTYMHICDIL